MNKDILKWYLNYIDNKKLNEMLNKVNLNIKGFSNTKKNKNKTPVPTKIAVKNILEDGKNYSEFKEYLGKEAEFYDDSIDIMDLLKEDKDVEAILKFLVGTNENSYSNEKEYLLDRIKSGNLSLDKKKYSNLKKNEISVDKVENLNNNVASSEDNEPNEMALNKNNEDINKLNESLKKLEESNKKLNNQVEVLKESKKAINSEKISLSKQLNVLTQEMNTLKRKLEVSQNKEVKSNENYNNLKNKYDELINKEREISNEKSELEKEGKILRKKEEELKEKNKELNKELENIKGMLAKVSKDKIAIIGEIENIHLKGSNYEFENRDFKDIDNLEELLQDFKEVWVILYELSALEQSKILRKENKYRVFKFKNFEEVTDHLNNGI